MSTDHNPPSTPFEASAKDTLIASLRNAHALEKQVISVLESQLKLLDDYPELHARLTEHVIETREQARRLEAALEACGASASMFKDALLSVMGMSQSSVQGFAEDAVLKAMLADMMTEHLEIASYRTLIVLADLAGKPELRPRLEETLREEEAMAAWFDENLESITRRFVELKAAEERPAATPTDQSPTAEGEKPPTVWQTLETAKQSEAHPKSAEPRGDDKPASAPASKDTDESPDRSVNQTSERYTERTTGTSTDPATGTDTPRSDDDQKPADKIAPRPTMSASRPSDI